VVVAGTLKDVGGQSFSGALVDYIEGAAVMITKYLDGEKPNIDTEPVYTALKRHGVLR
jgi:hypothetical protein